MFSVYLNAPDIFNLNKYFYFYFSDRYRTFQTHDIELLWHDYKNTKTSDRNVISMWLYCFH